MAAPDCCVIVPTVREFSNLRSYFANARLHHFDLSRIYVLLVTEDFSNKSGMEKMLNEEGVDGKAFNETDRKQWLQQLGLERFTDLIPRRSHAETSFGLLYMWANPQFTYGWLVDDDTCPLMEHDFFGVHLGNLLSRGPVNRVSSDKKWVNVLFQSFSRHSLYPRGYPYGCMGERLTHEIGSVGDIVLSQGLWTNVPDLDAIRILSQGSLQGIPTTRTSESDFGDPFVVESGSYLTISSMNLAFRREVVPAFYQFPMDDNPWGIGRFDDIWSGVLLKRIADALGKSVMTGPPFCNHDKASRNVFKDLRAEVPALELNEHLWEIVDEVPCQGGTYGKNYLEIAAAFRNVEKSIFNVEFLPFVSRHLERWIECLSTLKEVL